MLAAVALLPNLFPDTTARTFYLFLKLFPTVMKLQRVLIEIAGSTEGRFQYANGINGWSAGM